MSRAAVILVMSVSLSAPSFSWADIPHSDFDDGTLQGWAAISNPRNGAPFGGSLTALPTGGNPGGFMRVSDDEPGGGLLLVKGPAEFRGNLAQYTEVQYDEYLYNNPNVVQGVGLHLIGPDNITVWAAVTAPGPIAQWYTRNIPLQESAWILLPGPGTLSFADTLANGSLVLEMTVNDTIGLESGVDNVMLLPEPASAVLLLAGLFCCRVSRRG